MRASSGLGALSSSGVTGRRANATRLQTVPHVSAWRRAGAMPGARAARARCRRRACPFRRPCLRHPALRRLALEGKAPGPRCSPSATSAATASIQSTARSRPWLRNRRLGLRWPPAPMGTAGRRARFGLLVNRRTTHAISPTAGQHRVGAGTVPGGGRRWAGWPGCDPVAPPWPARRRIPSPQPHCGAVVRGGPVRP